MGRSKEVIDEELGRQAAAELKKITDAKVCIRLQGIISSVSYPMSLVAQILGIHRHTLWRWIKCFRQDGVDGLRDKPKGHNPAKLNEGHKRCVERWLATSADRKGRQVHWTLRKLAAEIEAEFGIKVGITPLWQVVRRLRFRLKVPRPQHAKANVQLQEEFKKKRRKR